MRDLLLTLLIPMSLVVALLSARWSVLVLNWIWFQRPYDFSWGVWNTLPTFQIAIVVTAVSNLIRGQLKLKFPPILVIYLLLIAWVAISSTFAYDQTHAWEFFSSYAPSMAIGPVLVYAVINDLQLLKATLWVAAGGVGFNALKYGVGLAAEGGAHIVEQIPGFVGDNNVFALVLCLVVAMLMGLRATLSDKKWARAFFFVCLAFVLLCIIYTKSRGALLTLGVIFLSASLLGGRPLRGLIVVAAIGALAYMAVPSDYFDRLSTLRDVQADASAMGRIDNWRLAWDAAVANPLLGVGPDNHMVYSIAMSPEVRVRVAHSVYFQVLGELGFVGFALYMAFVIMGLLTLWRTWRSMVAVAKEHPDLAWVRDLSFWMTCGYIGYLAGSALLNMFYIEFPWYAIFYGSMLWPLVQAELKTRGQARIGEGRQNAVNPGEPLVVHTRRRALAHLVIPRSQIGRQSVQTSRRKGGENRLIADS